MAKRPAIPTEIETRVLTSCRRRCCLCFYLSRRDDVRKGQIAHLNKDRADNRFENLCYLCLEHHDEFDSTTSQSKGLSAAEVRHYRDRLYKHYLRSAEGVAPDAEEDKKKQESSLEAAEVEHLQRVTTARLNEWKRLRADFEAEAKLYPAMTLTVYIFEKGKPIPHDKFGSPNHAVNLWQFSSDATSVLPVEMSRMGLRGTEVTAFGVVVGEKAEQFVRMAIRAGSMLPDDLAMEISTNAARIYGQSNSKPLLVANRTPLAKWLNFVLVSTVAFHPDRLAHNTLPVDPFAASLAAFDLILG
jgi:hypothetical protein